MIIFSIVTAFYKGNQYIPDLYRTASRNAAVLRENHIDASVELILVNDSPEYVMKISKEPNNIEVKVITHEVNSGIHQARVTGLQASRGDYIVFLDQDDLLSDDALYKEFLQIEGFDVVVANAYIERTDGTKKLLYKHKGQFKNALTLKPYIVAHDQIVSPGQCLIRKEAIPLEWQSHILKVNGSDDLFLWILMFSKGKKFTMLDQPIYTHCYTGENLSAEGNKMATSSLALKESLESIDYVDKKNIEMFVRRRELSINLSKSTRVQKLKIMVKNLDIYIARIFWKIRGFL